MSRFLIAYSTTDGHTPRICARLQHVIEGQGHVVTVVPLADAEALDLTGFDRIVLGASIRYGKHQPQVAQFIARHQPVLERTAAAFFSVNIVARKPEKNRPDTNPYLRKFLGQIAWKPAHLAVFAGKLDYPRYRPFDRFMIRLIMWMTKGPTDPAAVIEFTDWQQVEAFGRQVCEQV
ncbi:MAG: menaquinone-dependent protoporphyrinogen IX dehydrogenase [Comamonadaceae bacterium]|uniref:menaquinone-dependent protoporphyrinogen IX dehydrogenase n=1 Tax=Candidatus Skiveiella danica TaxID=3386177 RepID=UPI00390C2BA6|nr:menaquinone-dependent protoporphyrinogen IX dehydrogenase [Comamonadaceae bacterium]